MSSIKTVIAIDLTIPRDKRDQGLRLLVDTLRKTVDSLEPLIAVGHAVERVSLVRGGLNIVLRGSGLSHDDFFPPQHENMTIDDLNLPTLTRNALVTNGNIKLVRQLVQRTERDLTKGRDRVKNLGATGLDHIKAKLESHGLHLGMKLDDSTR